MRCTRETLPVSSGSPNVSCNEPNGLGGRLLMADTVAVVYGELLQNLIILLISITSDQYLESAVAVLLLQKLRPELRGARLFHSRAHREVIPVSQGRAAVRFKGWGAPPNNATGQTRTTGRPCAVSLVLSPNRHTTDAPSRIFRIFSER